MKILSVSYWRAARDDAAGLTAIEYGLIAAIMAAGVVAAFALLQGPMTTLFTNLGLQLLA